MGIKSGDGGHLHFRSISPRRRGGDPLSWRRAGFARAPRRRLATRAGGAAGSASFKRYTDRVGVARPRGRGEQSDRPDRRTSAGAPRGAWRRTMDLDAPAPRLTLRGSGPERRYPPSPRRAQRTPTSLGYAPQTRPP